MVKRISALAAVLLCVFMLCSCTASRSQIGAYVRGTLDSVYLNENSDEYLESVGGTAEECETQYQQYIRDEVEYFKMCMNIDEVSDATYQRMVKIFETLYAHCKYEVGEVTRSSDRFLVSVTVSYQKRRKTASTISRSPMANAREKGSSISSLTPSARSSGRTE